MATRTPSVSPTPRRLAIAAMVPFLACSFGWTAVCRYRGDHRWTALTRSFAEFVVDVTPWTALLALCMFAVWFRGAHRRAAAAYGQESRALRGPWRLAQEMWRASEGPARERSGYTAQRDLRDGSWLVTFWWFTLLAAIVTSHVVSWCEWSRAAVAVEASLYVHASGLTWRMMLAIDARFSAQRMTLDDVAIRAALAHVVARTTC